MHKRRWSELTRAQRTLVVTVGVIQVSLAVSAWADLAKRRPEDVVGSKRVWAFIIMLNFVGPLLYFRRGRRPAVKS